MHTQDGVHVYSHVDKQHVDKQHADKCKTAGHVIHNILQTRACHVGTHAWFLEVLFCCCCLSVCLPVLC